MRDSILAGFLWLLTTLWVTPIVPSSYSALNLIPSENVSSTPIFSEVTLSSGINFQHTDGNSKLRLFNEFLGSGGGFFDYDNDGDLDIYLVNGTDQVGVGSEKSTPNTLYRNDGDGAFSNVTDTVNVGDTGYGVGCTVGDYDNDGCLDLSSALIPVTKITEMAPSQMFQHGPVWLINSGEPVVLLPILTTTVYWTSILPIMLIIILSRTGNVKKGVYGFIVDHVPIHLMPMYATETTEMELSPIYHPKAEFQILPPVMD